MKTFDTHIETKNYINNVLLNTGRSISYSEIYKINSLVEYLINENLWGYARFFLMKSGQNSGTNILCGLGGLTKNNITLVNSPTWASTGITFNGSNQYGYTGQFTKVSNATIFIRHIIGGTNGLYLCDGTNFISGTGLYLSYNTNYLGSTNYRGARNDGASAGQSIFNTDTSGDNTVVYSNENGLTGAGGAIKCWKNKTSLTRNYSDINNTTRRQATGDLNICRRSDGTNYLSVEMSCFAYVETLLTTTQRETLTDMINAL